MKLGLSLGANALPADPRAARDIAQAAEALGLARLIAADHVLGADPDRPGGWSGPYTHEHLWHEPLVLFGYLAAQTERIEFMSGIVILPQRQTALVAKQAAELDVLSGGRFLLGVGVGWNAVEYQALGQPFNRRGARMDEQIALLRALWSKPTVSFEGRFERVARAGINPRPTRGDVPIWMGGHSDAALDRVGRIGDGWYPLFDDPALVAAGRERIAAAAQAVGRDPAPIGVQARIVLGGSVDDQLTAARAWRDAGVDMLLLGTAPGVSEPDQHIATLTAFVNAWNAAE
ncbi:MAG: LLM class F420-dependent oxidoreductase [Chloroflexi bacterium]|nr:LLM class F420-dependent oxidoreductase [Chloroflexota bacterium]MDA1002425.1 LLM class F420-dependent oxidoreductase [Chloroflexota bacterium]